MLLGSCNNQLTIIYGKDAIQLAGYKNGVTREVVGILARARKRRQR